MQKQLSLLLLLTLNASALITASHSSSSESVYESDNDQPDFDNPYANKFNKVLFHQKTTKKQKHIKSGINTRRQLDKEADKQAALAKLCAASNADLNALANGTK